MFQVTAAARQTTQRLSGLRQRLRIVSRGSLVDWARQGGSCRGSLTWCPQMWSRPRAFGRTGWLDLRAGSFTWLLLMLATSWELQWAVDQPRSLGPLHAAWAPRQGASRSRFPGGRQQRLPGQFGALPGAGPSVSSTIFCGLKQAQATPGLIQIPMMYLSPRKGQISSGGPSSE